MLGFSKVILFVLTVPMVWQLVDTADIRVPRAFGVYLIFLVWVALGVTMLWVRPPGPTRKRAWGRWWASPIRGFW